MSDYYSYQTDQPEPSIEDSELYKLICACSKSSMRDAIYNIFVSSHFRSLTMSDYFSYQTDQPEPSIEDSELYKLICACSKSSIRDAWRLAGNMQPEDIKMRSTKDRSTYLHLVVNIAPEVGF